MVAVDFLLRRILHSNTEHSSLIPYSLPKTGAARRALSFPCQESRPSTKQSPVSGHSKLANDVRLFKAVGAMAGPGWAASIWIMVASHDENEES